MEAAAPMLQMWLTFGVIFAAIFAYSSDRIPLEISSIATVAILLLMFQIFPVMDPSGETLLGPTEILKGFSDPALFTVLSLLVVGQGLVQTGALNAVARKMVVIGESFPRAIIVGTLITVLVTSAFLNNTPVVVIFIPILVALADKMGQQSSAVMMPLSFAAILGGNLTIIGSSTNLLVAGAYERTTGIDLGFFDFTTPGLVIGGIGMLYLIFIAPRLLVDRSSMSRQLAHGRGKQFIFQVEVSGESRLIDQTAIAGMFPGLKDVTIRMIQRGSEEFLPPYDNITLSEGDIVLLAATRSVMTELMNASPHMVSSAEEEEDDSSGIKRLERRVIAEAVVAPASRLDGRTLAQTGFRAETGCSVLGIQRRSRMIRASISSLRIEAGDVLLVMGSGSNVTGLRNNRDVLLLEWSATDVPMTELAPKALAVFGVIVSLAAFQIIPIVVAAMLGVVGMLVTGCLNVRQAARAIDRRVFTIVGAALALGAALSATGGASFIASGVVDGLEGAPTAVILSGFFLVIAVLTNVLSNNATAVLFTPIAVSIAAKLGVDPMPFIVAVIFGANCSFATPMGYQTNLLVMAPGHYRFKDFVRVGSPLIVIIWLTYSFFAPWYYGI